MNLMLSWEVLHAEFSEGIWKLSLTEPHTLNL